MPSQFPSITTGELRALLDEPDTTIIDARPADAYNGWRLRGEERGGHLPGARNVAAPWTRGDQWPDLLHEKRIDAGHALVVYGYDRDESEQVAGALAAAGRRDIRIYDGFVAEWTDDPALPLERLPRFDRIVPPTWLQTIIDGGRPEEFAGGRVVICHAHYRNPDDYHQGHIPGAVPLNTLDVEEPETWNRRRPEELKRTLEEHGIAHDTTVVVYGRYSDPDNRDPFPGSNAGQIGAMRCAMIMMYAGVADVRVLNGGLMAWEAAGLPTTDRPTEPEPVADFGAEIPGRPELMIDLPGAKQLLASDRGALVSIRSWPEFIGEVSGYNYIDVKGRIPGAIFGDCGSDAYHMENFRNPDHTNRESGQLESRWREWGVTPDKQIAFYCGTGWRASEACFNAYLAGWDDIAVYDGGWMQWSNDPDNPIETGIPAREAT